MTPRTLTDAQVHLFGPHKVPASEGSPAWARDLHPDSFTADDLLAKMDVAEVERAVLVTPGSEGDGNDVALAAARAHPRRLAVMGRLSLEQPDPERVMRWRLEPGMLGVRLTFNREPQARWLTNGVSDWFWPAADEAALPVMLAAAGQLEMVGTLAERYPRIHFVIDHLGLPIRLGGMTVDEAIGPLLELAALENVAAKASALPFYATDPFPFASLHSAIRRVVEAFGPERVMWGTDITRLSCSYDEATKLFTEALDFLSQSDLDWVMGQTAARWLNWPTET